MKSGEEMKPCVANERREDINFCTQIVVVVNDL